MKENEYRVSLPETVINEFHLDEETQVTLKMIDQKIVIEPAKNKVGNQTISLRWFLIPTIISSLSFFLYLYFKGHTYIPLVGSFSIANLVFTLGILSGSCSFIFFFVQGKRSQLKIKLKDIYWRNFPTILFSFVIILFFCTISIF